MNDIIKILILDDHPEDREKIENELRKVFLVEIEKITNRQELRKAISKWNFDIVITEYQLEWISGLDVLLMIKNRDPKLPVIMFTAHGNEEIAVKAMKIGLDDYLIKSAGHFNRIPVTINKIFNQIREREEKLKMESQLRNNEQRIKELMDDAIVGYYKTTPDGSILYANNTLVSMLGYDSLEDLQKRNLEEKGFEPDYQREYFKKMMAEKNVVRGLESTWLRKDGNHLYVRENAQCVRDDKGNILHYEGSAENITDVIQNRRLHQVIQSISKIILKDLSLDRFYELILENIRKLIKYGELYIAMYDDASKSLVLEKSNSSQQVISKELPEKNSLYYYLLHNHNSLLLSYEEYQKLTHSQHIYFHKKFTQWLGASIKGESGNIGALVAYHNEEYHYFTELERSMLEYLAAQIGVYIEKEKASEKIKYARKKAEESDRLKSYFLANISHELRTPLNGIIGFSNMITGTSDASQQIIHYGSLILRNAHALYNVLDNLIYFSLIESQELVSEPGEIEVYSFLGEYFEEFIDTHNKKALFYEFNKDNRYSSYVIKSDKRLLTKVLDNLMQNAFDFTEKGKIKLGFTIDEDNNQLVFYVSDTGKGIPLESQYKIFSNFVTLEDPYKGEYSGTGLGLSLSYKIIKMLKGAIWLESTEEQGTTFYFALPAGGESPIAPVINKLANKKILIIEDDRINYQLLEAILMPSNPDLIWAKNGKSGKEVFDESDDIDLILLDIFLPDMGGIELLKYFKKKNRNMPVISITAYAMDNIRRESMRAGTDAFITKPLRKKNLIKKINDLI